MQTSQKNAFIRDEALIMHFDQAETPCVARYDLNSLAQANFEVTNRSGTFHLTLRDFSGEQQTIAQFASKADAHQALYSILQALLAHNDNKPVSKKGALWLWRIVKAILTMILLAGVFYAVLHLLLIPPASQRAVKSANVPGVEANTASTAIPGSSESSPNVSQDTGEPVDLDALLAEPSK